MGTTLGSPRSEGGRDAEQGYIEGFYAWNRIAAVISDLVCKSGQKG